jgi:hypothetical protein
MLLGSVFTSLGRRIMDFDKGWKRLEAIGLVAAVLIIVFMFFAVLDEAEARNKPFSWIFEDVGGWIFVLSLSLTPWLTLKITKWIIDGFRSKEDKVG